MGPPQADDRLRELIDASIVLTSELSLDVLLQRVIDTGVQLTDATYGALGVIDQRGEGLERFITSGLSEEEMAAIGELPRGRGILGVLIRDARPLRLSTLGDDPRSVGFPPNHPTMTSFLGVPVTLRGVAYGNLYLTEKRGGEFTEEDQDVVTMLAAQAAVAIENARLYESATRWSRQLETLHEVVRSMVEEMELDHLLALICSRVRELTGARLAIVVLPVDDGRSFEIAGVDGNDVLLGELLPGDTSKVARVFGRRQGTRVDSLIDDPDVHPTEARLFAARTGLFEPLVASQRAMGVIAVFDKVGTDLRFTDADQRLLEIFAARAAVAVSLSERVAHDMYRRVITAQEEERGRLARELHDETGQALTSILLGIKAIRAADSPEKAAAAEDSVRELVVQALQDVRTLAVELRPPALDDFGLGAALTRLGETFGERSGIETAVEVNLAERLPSEIETTVYRLVQEALTNVAKHSGARRVSVVVGLRDHQVTTTIDDDGQGFDESEVRSDALGLVGMRERLSLLGGRLAIESSAVHGTTVAAKIPVAAG